MTLIGEHTHNFTARLIQFWMFVHALLRLKKPTVTYNHLAIYDEKEDVVYESVSKKVIGVIFDEHEKHHPNKTIKKLKLMLAPWEERRMRKYLKNQVGKGYEYSNFFWHIWYTLSGIWLGQRNNKKLYCYELGIRAMNASGAFKLKPFLNPFEFWNKLKD